MPSNHVSKEHDCPYFIDKSLDAGTKVNGARSGVTKAPAPPQRSPGAQKSPSHPPCRGRECRRAQTPWRTVWRVLEKLTAEPPHDPATPLPKEAKSAPQRDRGSHARCGFIHKPGHGNDLSVRRKAACVCAAEQHAALGGERPSSATARTDVEGAVLTRQTTPAKMNAAGAYLEKTNPKKKRVEKWLPGLGGPGRARLVEGYDLPA